MAVAIHDILHVLAHELRTPIGVTHGYVRLLLEDRLLQESDRRRALEQMQKALGRLSDLSRESTALAAWFEHPRATEQMSSLPWLWQELRGAEYDGPITFTAPPSTGPFRIASPDPGALVNALAAGLRATARELRGAPCHVRCETPPAGAAGYCDLLAGPPELLASLQEVFDTPGATPLTLERGGLGLSLVHAAAVLDVHHAICWTLPHTRQALGVRLPLSESGPS